MNESHNSPDCGAITFDEEFLVGLNRRIKRAQFVHKRQQALLAINQKHAFVYQDIISSRNNPERYPIRDQESFIHIF
jgi:hypothetical protein